MNWLAIVSTAIGVDHINADKPCQDSANYKFIDDQTIIGVVSDGMGSAKYSHLGSNLAVEIIISELSISQIGWETYAVNQDSVRLKFEEAIKNLKSKLESEAKKLKACSDDFACTLLAFVVTPRWLAAIQIGDGIIIIRPKNGNYSLVFQPTKGEFVNETEAVTSQNVLQELNFYFKEVEIQFICAATDGIENISLNKEKFQDWQPSANFFSPLEEHMLSDDSKDQKEEDLEKFLNSDRINNSTKDDKALLICLHQTGLIHQSKCNVLSRSEDSSLKSTLTSPEKPYISLPEKINCQNPIFCEEKRYAEESEHYLKNKSYKQIENRVMELLKTKISEPYFMLGTVHYDGHLICVFLKQKKIFCQIT